MCSQGIWLVDMRRVASPLRTSIKVPRSVRARRAGRGSGRSTAHNMARMAAIPAIIHNDPRQTDISAEPIGPRSCRRSLVFRIAVYARMCAHGMLNCELVPKRHILRM